MSNHFKAAVVGLRTGKDIPTNLKQAAELIREAKSKGADYVQTPEQTGILDLNRQRLFSLIKEEQRDDGVKLFSELAKELEIWIHIGSLGIKVAEKKAANRSYFFNPKGEIAAKYDKIHMFDVTLSDGESYRESEAYNPGRQIVLVDLPWGRLGASVCYDLRFPSLYRTQAHNGAFILTAPAAFTKTTGEDHWHVLQRARAIENGAYMISAAQGGTHEDGRQTFGHSLIINPWGKVIAESGDEPGVTIAEINMQEVIDARNKIPNLKHDILFRAP